MCGIDLLCLRVRIRVFKVVYVCLCVCDKLTCVLLLCTSIAHEASLTVCLRAHERQRVAYVCYDSAFVHVCAERSCARHFCMWYAYNYVHIMCYICVCMCEPCIDSSEVAKHSV